jgi:hypothetical protein
MAPQEVAGLQALAMAHGGKLTINPDTGLPEAGFLSKILPTLIGAGLSFIPGVGPLLAAGIVGGGTTLATGSLKKGLMAGFGAYGGAGLANGLLSAGAAGAGAAGAGASAGTATQAAMSGLGTGPAGALLNPTLASTAGNSAVTLGAAPANALSSFGAAPVGGGLTSFGASPIAAATPIPAAAPTFSSQASQAFRGLESLGTEAGREAFMGKAASKGVEATGVGGTKGLLQYGMAGLSPMMFQDPEKVAKKEEKPYEYTFDYGRVADPNEGYTGAETGQRTYFKPRFVRTAADGGLMDTGPVQAMSDRNDAQMMMANNGQMFADGGITGSGNLNLNIPLDLGGGQGGSGGSGGASYPFANSGATSQSGFGGQNNASGGGQLAPPAFAVMPRSNPYGGDMQAGYAGTAANGFQTPLGGAAPLADPMLVGQKKPGSTFLAGMGGNPYYAPSNGFDAPSNGFEPIFENSNPRALSGGLGAALRQAIGRMSPESYRQMGALTGYGPNGFNHGGGRSANPTASMFANGGFTSMAQGGSSHLGDYSDGGRLLKGPGDGVSDSIPATIADKRPARLADGEFVVPARIVSELGNGSTEAGARKLYAMMDRVQKARKKSIGKDRVAVNSLTEKMLPA